MYGRRDLVDAHLFLRGRLTAAVLRSDPDAPERPLRRTGTGMGIGLAVAAGAVLVVVVLHIFLFTSNDSWKDTPGALLVSPSTGARYLFVDGALHPVRNVTSAALLAGGPPTVIEVSSDDIAGVPRGESIGVDGLPDALPSPAGGDRSWTACAVDGGTSLTVGEAQTAAPTEPLGEGDAVLVRADDELALVWNGTRLRVAGDWAARAIGFEPGQARGVDARWLNTLPSGPDLALDGITLGGDGPEIAGERGTLGQLVEVEGAGEQPRRYVIVEDGLRPVTDTDAALLAATPDGSLPEPRTITARELASAPVVEASGREGLPAAPPSPVAAGSVPCAVWHDGATTTALAEAGTPAATDAVATVGPDEGLLVTTAAADGVSGQGLFLVGDGGSKYPVADADTASALGVDATNSPAVPAELLALLPTGPTIAK
ncbi:type VII secretion protein EccB [Mycetocola reblochoni]|uniref:Type VII secretion protein EccB n=2 Tax=Mycetocola reblochoni TaxID=331618 RepID=A0A3L6ZN20_9MICO|nr:type VII secretion protein EccB [Mycetocola reblochoni]RLP68941.1 type VII secretion protein EccB [Mycetocola reblochoni]SJN16150.1 PROBABLE CONSERVED MEMBRANE PROTEIN [Mycetocola reblochoni REB411]